MPPFLPNIHSSMLGKSKSVYSMTQLEMYEHLLSLIKSKLSEVREFKNEDTVTIDVDKTPRRILAANQDEVQERVEAALLNSIQVLKVYKELRRIISQSQPETANISTMATSDNLIPDMRRTQNSNGFFQNALCRFLIET